MRHRRGVRGPEYARRYTAEVLDHADLLQIASGCVERGPEARHTSLIAHRLAECHGATVEHLRPA